MCVDLNVVVFVVVFFVFDIDYFSVWKCILVNIRLFNIGLVNIGLCLY